MTVMASRSGALAASGESGIALRLGYEFSDLEGELEVPGETLKFCSFVLYPVTSRR